jgi:two-component system nitrogen regulation response regulator GlnG
LVQSGKFREDLYHRLNVIRIHIPKLAHRSEDIPKLAEHFLARAAKELAVSPKQLKAETKDYLKQLPWPGNVRQLENTCRWLTVMITGREIYPDDLPTELRQIPLRSSQGEADQSSVDESSNHTAQTTQANFNTNAMQNFAWDELLGQWALEKLQNGEMKILEVAAPMFEKTLILAALNQTRGRKRHAAELLGWGRNTLTRKMKELGMDGSDDED